MAMLESTPYRVFYLINKPDMDDYHIHIFNWNQYRGAVEDSDRSTIRRIVAPMTKENDFYSVKVKVLINDPDNPEVIGDYVDYNREYTYDWNDIDDEIVYTVNNYYNQNSDARRELIGYADMIQALCENKESIKLSISSDGYPRLEVKGLPYIDEEKREVLSLDTAISQFKMICEYDLRIDEKGKESIYGRPSKLREMIAKAEKYDSMLTIISNFLDRPEGILNSLYDL